MAEKKEKKSEKQVAYIGLTLVFVLFIAAVMALVKFRLVHPVNLYVVSEAVSSEAEISLPEEQLAGTGKENFQKLLNAKSKRAASEGSSASQDSENQDAVAAQKVNINTADQETLESLPGIGPALAERILLYRQEHGAFSDIEEIMSVKGIGEKKFEKLRELITV